MCVCVCVCDGIEWCDRMNGFDLKKKRIDE